MGFFEDLGLEDRAARREARQSGGVPVNTSQPVGTPVMATAQPGMTAEQARALANDPTNARLSSGSGGEPFSESAFFDFMEQYPPTNEGMRAGYEAAKQRWGNQVPELLEHPQRLDKFKFADGRTFDVIGGAGGPNPSWVRNLEGPGHGGGSTLGQLGGMTNGGWQSGLNPGFNFAIKEAQKGLERSAAAKGTINTGGFQKELAQHLSDFAMFQGFQPAFNNNFSLAQLGLQATGQAAGLGSQYSNTLGQNTNNQVGTNVDLTTGAANAQAGVTAGNATGWGNTIGELGTVLAPTAATWLRRGKGGDPYAYRTPPYFPERMDGTV